MRYAVQWRDEVEHKSDSRFATWNERVTDTTPGLKWALGMNVGIAIERIKRYRGKIILDPDSAAHSTIERKSS